MKGAALAGMTALLTNKINEVLANLQSLKAQA